jgi:hypothetical protein
VLISAEKIERRANAIENLDFSSETAESAGTVTGPNLKLGAAE